MTELSATAVPSGARRSPHLPAWLWLWLPLVLVFAQPVLVLAAPDFYESWIGSELGLVQNLTIVFLVVAIAAALRLRSLRERVASRWFGPFCAVMALGCLFFAGEEASWGQHWFGFAPPEYVAARNDQAEFNLHNDSVLGPLLDSFPRTLLTLAALVGGILVPFTRRRRDVRPDFASASPLGWLWPTAACLPVAVLAVTVTLPEKVAKRFVDDPPEVFDMGETKELLLALFLMLYLIVLLRELRLRTPHEERAA